MKKLSSHIDDEIFRVREFMHELMKVQDRYYKKLEKKFLKDKIYSLDRVKKDLKQLTGHDDLIKTKQELKEWFWDYMYNNRQEREEDQDDDFFGYILRHQQLRNAYIAEQEKKPKTLDIDTSKWSAEDYYNK